MSGGGNNRERPPSSSASGSPAAAGFKPIETKEEYRRAIFGGNPAIIASAVIGDTRAVII
jgi:hypothetical protein